MGVVRTVRHIKVAIVVFVVAEISSAIEVRKGAMLLKIMTYRKEEELVVVVLVRFENVVENVR